MRMNIVLGALLSGLLAASACLADASTQASLDRAVAICDHEIQDASSGRYSEYRTGTLAAVLTEILGHVGQARTSLTNANVLAELGNLSGRLETERSEAYSGRWSSYRLSTVITLLATTRDSLDLAKRLDDPAPMDATVEALNAAIAVCDFEIREASSGRFANYQLGTALAIFSKLQAHIERARATAREAASLELRNLHQRLSFEINDGRSGRWSSYSNSTMINLLHDYRASLQLAARFHSQS